MNTENLPRCRIQPILTKHSITITSKAQLTNIKKKRLNVSTFKLPKGTSYFVWQNRAKDYKPKQMVHYFKNQKFLTGLEIMGQELKCLYTFSRVESLMRNLRKFSVFAKPVDEKLKNCVEEFERNKTYLNHILISDYNLSQYYWRKKTLLTHFYDSLIKMKSFISPSLKGCSRLRTLEISNLGLLSEKVRLPATLEYITLTGALSEDDVKKMNTLKKLKQLNLNAIFNDSYQLVFRNLHLNNITVQLTAPATMLTDPETVDSVKRFIEETNSKVVFIPRNYSNEELRSCLAFLEQNFNGFGDLFQMELPFAFNFPLEVQESMLTYYAKMTMSVQRVLFSLEIGALYKSEDLRKENWKKMLDLATTDGKSNKLQKVMFHVKYDYQPWMDHNDLLNVEVAVSLIKPIIENKMNGIFNPGVEVHIELAGSKGDDRLLDFLNKALILVQKDGLSAYEHCSNLYFKIEVTNIALRTN